MRFWDMPAPAPPPRLTLRSAEVQDASPAAAGEVEPAPAAGVADAVAAADDEPVPPPLVLAPPVLAAPELVPAELDVEPGAAADDEDDDAAHPAVSTPAASSGMVSSALFTRSPSYARINWPYDAAAARRVASRSGRPLSGGCWLTGCSPAGGPGPQPGRTRLNGQRGVARGLPDVSESLSSRRWYTASRPSVAKHQAADGDGGPQPTWRAGCRGSTTTRTRRFTRPSRPRPRMRSNPAGSVLVKGTGQGGRWPQPGNEPPKPR